MRALAIAFAVAPLLVGPATAQVRAAFGVMIPMRDGVKLGADIWRPKGPGRYPVVLARTPYFKRRGLIWSGGASTSPSGVRSSWRRTPAAEAGADLAAVVQRHIPGRSRFALDRRNFRSAVSQSAPFGGLVTAGSTLRFNCGPIISVNGARPWPGRSLADFKLDEIEALEIYRRATGLLPTEFANRATDSCGLVVVWLK